MIEGKKQHIPSIALGVFTGICISACFCTLLGHYRVSPNSVRIEDRNRDGNPDVVTRSNQGEETIFYSYHGEYLRGCEIEARLRNEKLRSPLEKDMQVELQKYKPAETKK